MARFVVIIVTIAMLSLLVGFLLNYLGVWLWTNSYAWVILFLAGLTVIVHYVNLGALHESGQGSILMFLISMVIKLLLGGAFILYLIYLKPAEMIATVAAFFTFYALFTAVEIYSIWKKLQH